jgi:hypothetical protein
MLAAVNTVAPISARYGTMFSGPRPLSAVAVSANTKVAMNVPKLCFMTGSSRNQRRNRGENWLLPN